MEDSVHLPEAMQWIHEAVPRRERGGVHVHEAGKPSKKMVSFRFFLVHLGFFLEQEGSPGIVENELK